MNGIKMSDCKFYVNEEERVVVCVIQNTADMVLDFILENFSPKWILSWSELKMPNSFIGKAVCSKDDEWNEETGRLIAFSRAKDKCYRSFFKRAQHYVQTVDGCLGDMVEIFNKLGEQVSKNKTQLEDRIKAATNK